MTTAAAPAARHPVEELAEDFLTRFRRGERPSLSEYVQHFPDVADELAGIIQALMVLDGLGVDGEFAGDPAAPLPDRLGEYRLVREIGRGGMGVVYEAEQGELGRRVALKILPAAALLQPTHLERFRREARAAARLHHTNIVPVFGVGMQDGLHYYAMQHIDGQGLDKIIEELRQQQVTSNADTAKAQMTPLTSSGPTDSSEYHRSVARLGVQVAAALAHAHEHGVLHRDVKPANVLIDEHGTAWLGDFGLAQHTDDVPLTSTGGFVGTLRYLAPERFKGEGDARSDVYSLGATLYELLTLRPMFDETDRVRLVRQVAEDHPPSPRRVVPTIPKDLETIVVKATAKLPGDRYATAGELAEDLQRFLADRPVTARPVPTWEQVRRWVRRNPLVTASFTAVVLSLGIGLGATWWQWQRAQAETSAKTIALDQAQKSASEADAQSLRAHTHARRSFQMLEELMQSLTATPDSLEKVDSRRYLLERALRVHDNFMAQTELESFDRREVAQLATQVAGLHRELRNSRLADERFQKALALVEPEASAPAGNVDFRAAKGKALLGYGRLLRQMGRLDEYEQRIRESLAIFRALQKELPASRDVRRNVGLALNNLAVAASDRKQADEAIVLYRESISNHEALAQENANDVETRASLVMAYKNLAIVLRRKRSWDESAEATRAALKLAEEITQRVPASTYFQDLLADSTQQRGLDHLVRGQDGVAKDKDAARREFQEAEPFFRRSLAGRMALADRFRDDPVVSSDLGATLHNLALTCSLLGRTPEADSLYDQAISAQKDALRLRPEDLTALRCLVGHYRMQGDNRNRTGDHARAAELVAAMTKVSVPQGYAYFLATTLLGQCVIVADRDGTLTAENRQAIIEQYTRQALAHLRQAIERGFRDSAIFANLPELKPFRDRPDFRQIVAELEAKQKTNAAKPGDSQ